MPSLATLAALLLASFQEAGEGGAAEHLNPLADPIGHVHHKIVYEQINLFGLHLDISSLHITNTVVTMWAAAAVVALLVTIACRNYPLIPRGFRNCIEAVAVFIRDDVVYQYLEEEDARRLSPFFLSVFFFILACNLSGLLPIPGVATPTGNVNVTGTMAGVTLSMIFFGGMAKQGPIAFWKNLVPHGIQPWLWPLMFAIEVLGIFAKGFALTIRLFANMTAGHIVIFVLVAFIVVFKSYFVAALSVPGAVAIYLLEIFVAFLQAYIFTFLSAVFVGAALHPEH